MRIQTLSKTRLGASINSLGFGFFMAVFAFSGGHLEASGASRPADLSSSSDSNNHSTVLPPVRLNPDSIQSLLLENNTQVMLASKQLHQARLRQKEQRSALFPSLRLGLSVLAGGTLGLVFSSADFLLNFLLPSTWFENARQKSLVKAEENSYLALKSNQYATSLNLYYGLGNDLELRNFLLNELNDAREIEFLAQEALENGFGSEEDLSQAVSQTSTTHVELLKVEDLLSQNMASMKASFGIPQEQKLFIDIQELPESDLEKKNFSEAFASVYSKAPEVEQLEHLEAASKAGKWSSIFAFIQSFTVSAASSVGSDSQPETADFAFDSLSGRGSLDLGFYQFPRYQLASSDLDIVKIRQVELRRELSRVLKVALDQLSIAEDSLALAELAEREETKVYNLQKQRYLEGRISMSELIITKSRLRGAAISRLQAENGLRIIRSALHRLDLSDRFAKIERCHASEIDHKALKKAVKSGKTLEEICAARI